MVRDSFPVTAKCFVSGYDRLALDESESFDPQCKAAVRPLLQQAEFLVAQKSNPFRSPSRADLAVMDLAGCFLRWAADFASTPAWWDLFTARDALAAELDGGAADAG